MNEIFFLGIVVFSGFLGSYLLSKLKIPAVTGYIIVGLLLGTSFLRVIPLEENLRMSYLINLALLLIAFTIGGSLKRKDLREMGKSILSVVFAESIFAFVFIFLGMKLCGGDTKLSLIVASLGSATAPAATVLVLRELRAKGPLTTTLLACVGMDDAIGITLFSICASLVQALSGGKIHPAHLTFTIFVDISASIICGIIGGIVLVFLMRLISYDIQALLAVIGSVLFINGPLYGEFHGYHFSPLLSAMVMGYIFSNYSPREFNVWRSLEYFGYPFYLIYFVLAGARLEVKYLLRLGAVAGGYLVGRLTGKYIGAWVGGIAGKAPAVVKKYAGFGLVSQAGIAIGLALMAADRFPQYAPSIIAIALGTTVVTEIIGPILTRFAVTRAKETGK